MFRSLSRTPLLLALVALPALVVGCGGSKLRGTLIDGVRTVVEPPTITAGGTAHVTCELIGADRYSHLTTTFSVHPDGVVATVGDGVTTTVAGTYTVICAVPEVGVVDPVGAELKVVAGKPVSVRPILDENPIVAGTTTGVRCAAVDQFGNPAALTGTPVGDPPLVFGAGTVGSEVAGSFDITCDTPDFPSLPRDVATLEVVPGEVAGVQLMVDPDRTTFAVGAAATFYWIVVDAYGNAIDDAPGTLSAPTDPGVALLDAATHRYRFAAEGRYTFRVTLDPPFAPLSDDLTIVVDSSAPVLSITFPERGATLAGDGQPVVVLGKITDTWSGVDTFTINGDDVTVGPDGSFAFPLPPHWGINLIDARAADAGGNAVKLTPTFQYSADYLPFVASNAEGLKFDDGMVMLLGQNFLDDGVHDHGNINDMATLLEVILGGIDLDGALDQTLGQFGQTVPLADYSWTLGVAGVSWTDITLHGQLDITLESVDTTLVDSPRVDIDSRTGGLDLDMIFGDALQKAVVIGLKFSVHASFELKANACSFIGCIQALDTTVFADATLTSGISIDGINVSVHTNIAKAPGAPLAMSFSNFDLSLDTLNIDPVQDVVLSLGIVNLPVVGNQTLSFALSDFIDLNALIGGLIDPIANLLTTGLPPLIDPLIEGLAGPLFAGLFDALSIDTSFEIPPILGPKPQPYYLDFYTDLSSVAFTDPGGTLGIATGFYAAKGVERDPLGAILRAGCLNGASDSLVWGWNPSVGIGLQADMLNAAFFGAWWTGYLDGPVDASALAGGSIPIPIDNLQVSLRWLLPPTLDTCASDGLGVEVGDLFVDLSGTALGSAVHVTLYADLGFDAAFQTSPAGLSLMIGALTFSDFEVITEDAGALGDAFNLRALVEDVLPDLLGGFLVGQEFGPFNLPPTDLSATIPSLPPGTSVGLVNLGVTTQDGYIVIGGDLGQ